MNADLREVFKGMVDDLFDGTKKKKKKKKIKHEKKHDKKKDKKKKKCRCHR